MGSNQLPQILPSLTMHGLYCNNKHYRLNFNLNFSHWTLSKEIIFNIKEKNN